MDNYQIVVWHKTDTEGHHNQILMGAKTLPKLWRDFAAYRNRPKQYRSFDERNLVQLYCVKENTVFNIMGAWQ